MTTLAQSERAALADRALAVGPDEPTLCGDWLVKHLLAHLVLRESSPAAAGITIPGLGGVAEAATQRLARKDFAVLVERFRKGAPFYSPFAVSKVDALFNAMEFYIHHEDIRRAQPEWAPRELDARSENALWRAVRGGARGLLRNVDHGIKATRTDTSESAVLRDGQPSVTLVGLPSEIALFVYGRQAQSHVAIEGDPVLVEKLKGSTLGI
jgi:uncharacterized protein (TIGR03085 family)